MFDGVFRSDSEDSASESCSNSRTSSEAYAAAVAVAAVRLVSSLLLSRLLMRYKRRSLYFCSALLTISFLLAFASSNVLIDAIERDDAKETKLLLMARSAIK